MRVVVGIRIVVVMVVMMMLRRLHGVDILGADIGEVIFSDTGGGRGWRLFGRAAEGREAPQAGDVGEPGHDCAVGEKGEAEL